MYKEAVLDKPQVLLLNKMDCTGSQLEYDRTVDMLSNLKGIPLVVSLFHRQFCVS